MASAPLAQSELSDSNADGIPDAVDERCPLDPSLYETDATYAACVNDAVVTMELDPVVAAPIVQSAATKVRCPYKAESKGKGHMRCRDCHKS